MARVDPRDDAASAGRSRRPHAGRRIIEPDDENELNIGPVLSPDGSRLAFLSSRDRLSIDLFVADAATGRIQRKLISTAADPHFDSLQFISSAGAWDPAGRQLAVAAIREGKPGDRDHQRRQRRSRARDRPRRRRRSVSSRVVTRRAADRVLRARRRLQRSVAVRPRIGDGAQADQRRVCRPAAVVVARRTASGVRDRSVQFSRSTRCSLASTSWRRWTSRARARRVSRPSTARGTSRRSGAGTAPSTSSPIPTVCPDVYRMSSRRRRAVARDAPHHGRDRRSPRPARRCAVAADGSRLAVVVYRNSTYEIHADRRRSGCVAANRPRAGDAGRRATGAGESPRRRSRSGAPLVDDLGLPAGAAPAAVEDYDPDLSLDYIGQEFGVTTNSSLGGYVGGGIAFALQRHARRPHGQLAAAGQRRLRGLRRTGWLPQSQASAGTGARFVEQFRT